ncbi:MAG: 23S rRNA (guanosine(2251)-2'-O)-methyltransferase RlmB [Acidimicrobiales bacterium]
MAGRKPKKRAGTGRRQQGSSQGQGSGQARSRKATQGQSRKATQGQSRKATQGQSQGQSRKATQGQSRKATQGQSQGSRRRRPTKGLGGDQIEGRQAVRELLLAGKRRIDEVIMIDDLAGADVLEDIEELSHEFGVSLRKVSRRHMAAEALTESHQGVIARAAPVAEADLERLMADPAAFLVVLDGITDPGNLGAILRTAECAGVTGVILGRHRSVHLSPTVTKTAAGAVEHVPLALVGGIPTAISQLNDADVFTVGLDGGGDRSIFELPQLRSGPTALVLGAEGAGLSRLVRQRVSVLASIPLAGQLNSLNVATATAVACFEVVRARESPID